jgi:hypothetical protein
LNGRSGPDEFSADPWDGVVSVLVEAVEVRLKDLRACGFSFSANFRIRYSIWFFIVSIMLSALVSKTIVSYLVINASYFILAILCSAFQKSTSASYFPWTVSCSFFHYSRSASYFAWSVLCSSFQLSTYSFSIAICVGFSLAFVSKQFSLLVVSP